MSIKDIINKIAEDDKDRLLTAHSSTGRVLFDRTNSDKIKVFDGYLIVETPPNSKIYCTFESISTIRTD